MSKADYMKSLEKLLGHLPKEEMEKAMEYYEEYFADAGAENEARAIEDLGTPEMAAESIIKTLAINNAKEPVRNIKKGFSSIWIGLLAVFGIPIGIPVALVLAAAIFLIILAIFLVLLSLFCVAVILAVCGVMGVIVSLFGITYGVGVFCTIIGMGLLSGSLGVLLFIETMKLSKGTMTLLTRLLSRIVKKRSKTVETIEKQ